MGDGEGRGEAEKGEGKMGKESRDLGWGVDVKEGREGGRKARADEKGCIFLHELSKSDVEVFDQWMATEMEGFGHVFVYEYRSSAAT